MGGVKLMKTTVAFASDIDQASALSCLHLFRSLGSEVGLALSGAIIQHVLQQSVYKRLSNKMTESDADALVDRVRKSLEFLGTLEPDLSAIIRECYGVAVRWCLGLAALFAAGSFIACFAVKEKRISGR